MKKNSIAFIAVMLCVSIIFMGCGASNQTQGALIGAGGGALVEH